MLRAKAWGEKKWHGRLQVFMEALVPAGHPVARVAGHQLQGV